jgi:septal ring factor EnvC (AmiA/AmiB activator)
VIRTFGPYEHEATHAVLSRRGIDLDVEDGTEVVAPADGVVRYSGPIRGLDRGVIIDHGGFFSVLAKLADSLPPAGTRVTHGDRVGRAAHHRVYLEIRGKLGPGGLPIDPQPLLARP